MSRHFDRPLRNQPRPPTNTLNVLALVHFIKRVPETKGLSLEQIERQLA